MKTFYSQLFTLVALSCAFIGSLATNAQARLGESKAQLVERYGEPVRDETAILPGSSGAVMFLKDNVEVHVEFKGDKAWMVTYRTHALTSELEVSLRDANDGEEEIGEWSDPVEHLGRNYWRTEDGKVTAVSYIVGSLKVFKFCTEDCVAALVDLRKEQINSAVAGAPADNSGAEASSPIEGEAEKPAKSKNPF
ncbi:MAG: hypothetical protein O3C21_06510 [Verrucomicrobia bacterium]|nr:hypothetical protein [Verrucomicrobiota bacterium]